MAIIEMLLFYAKFIIYMLFFFGDRVFTFSCRPGTYFPLMMLFVLLTNWCLTLMFPLSISVWAIYVRYASMTLIQQAMPFFNVIFQCNIPLQIYQKKILAFLKKLMIWKYDILLEHLTIEIINHM